MTAIPETINTGQYKVASGAYLGAIARLMLGRLWWLGIVPCCLFIAGAYDWRYAVIGLIFLFLIYPFAMTLALLSHGLRPEVVRRASATRAEISGDKITLYKTIEPTDGDDTPREMQIEQLKITDTIPAGRYTRLIVGPHLYDFILVPGDTVPADNPDK